MYGNIESGQPGQEWGTGACGDKACSELYPMEENLYEPLDPPITAPSRKHSPDPPVSPARQSCPQDRLLLVGAVALGVSVLLNVFLLSLGTRQISALTAALEEAEKPQPNSNMTSRSFLLYNRAHNMCVEARGQQLTAAPCRPEAAAQRFQWLPGKRLWNAERRRCVTAAAGRNLSVVELRPCREDGGLQRWECGDGGLLALAGMRLYFNYGNNALRTVMLYVGDREWSRWVVHGSNDDLCTRSCCPICPQGWTYFGGSCYFYSKTAKTWDNARGFCSAHGAQLLEVDGPEEKAHIQSTLSLSSWLGIRDEELEGTWKRANGSIVIRGHGSWHWSEPNGGRRENCAAVRTDGMWYDYPCSSELPWVCEGQPWACEGNP
ncbi:macrophage mannose receptor 1-like isoform X2 [Gallus gallus]|uniref:macrophage mannose receptor 1-like isoform X2 n=1 Tax=Gallus gallus TaxID=9031 RepID=UPI001F01D46D|nr:macrophage mannose receptor 1-like isoform X2 [Gallus gallus]XP_040550430.2 macrophage mannose receptor 1-like isoform X2 [Gallus gallus]